MPKKTTVPESKFTTALNIVFQENEWRLPDSYLCSLYEEHIRRLEREIEVLTKGRSTGPSRINPIDKVIPS